MYHLLLASAQRVKALILEEIALDSTAHLIESTSRKYTFFIYQFYNQYFSNYSTTTQIVCRNIK